MCISFVTLSHSCFLISKSGVFTHFVKSANLLRPSILHQTDRCFSVGDEGIAKAYIEHARTQHRKSMRDALKAAKGSKGLRPTAPLVWREMTLLLGVVSKFYSSKHLELGLRPNQKHLPGMLHNCWCCLLHYCCCHLLQSCCCCLLHFCCCLLRLQQRLRVSYTDPQQSNFSPAATVHQSVD